jgi:hypothetical protein
MAPKATNQNQKTITLTVFQLAEILPKWALLRNKIQWRIFALLSHPLRGTQREYYWPSPLCPVYSISDLQTSRGTTLGTFADDTEIFATHEDPTLASLNLQEHISSIEKWLQKWKIKVNESKSSHITFTLRTGHSPAVSINQTIIPQAETVKYLCLQFDRRIT